LLRDPFLLLSALTLTALCHMWRREPKETLDMARRALQMAPEVGAPIWEGRAMSLYHWAATVLEPGAAKTHCEVLSTGLTTFLAAGPYGRTALTPCVVEVFARAGRVSEALRELDDALRFVEVSDEGAWASELHRLRGELLKDADLAEAERAMTTALEVATAQGARAFELRAAMSLARLRAGKRRPSAALKELRRIHALFTEGLETSDLAEAKALLDEGR
jgi:hypothetical protein